MSRAAWTATLAFIVAAIASIIHLAKRDVASDEGRGRRRSSSGFVFSILATVTGSILSADVMWGSF